MKYCICRNRFAVQFSAGSGWLVTSGDWHRWHKYAAIRVRLLFIAYTLTYCDGFNGLNYDYRVLYICMLYLCIVR